MSKPWPVKTLGEIFEVARGGSPRPIQDFLTEDPAGINWVMISDATESDKFIERTAKRIRPEGTRKSRRVAVGDFLLTNSMSFGRPYIMRTDGCIHDGWLQLRKRRDDVDEDFFFHLLSSPLVYAQFAKLAAGATVKNLNSDLVRGVYVPHPPKEEQQRIARILDKANGLRRKRQEAISLSDDLLRAIFVDMFGDPVLNSKGWPTTQLASVCSVATGATPSREVDAYFEGPHPWVKTGEVDCDWIECAEEAISDRAIAETNCKLFPPKTVLVAMYGQGKTRGKVGMLAIPAATNQACAAILPSPDMAPEFLLCHLQLMYEHLRGMGRGGNQENLNLGMIKSLVVLQPPRDLVNRFVSVRLRVLAMRSKAVDGLTTTDELATSLAQQFLQ